LQDASAEVLGPLLVEECRRAFPEVQLRIVGLLNLRFDGAPQADRIAEAMRDHLARIDVFGNIESASSPVGK
jgi:hypothetical protein